MTKPEVVSAPDDSIAHVFPSSKIKAALQAHPEMGILRQPVVDLVGACSALLVHELVGQAAQEASSRDDDVVVTLEALQEACRKKYPLLEGVLDGLEEGVHAAIKRPSPKQASSKKSNKRRKALPPVNLSLLAEQQRKESPRHNETVIPDQDDYD